VNVHGPTPLKDFLEVDHWRQRLDITGPFGPSTDVAGVKWDAMILFAIRNDGVNMGNYCSVDLEIGFVEVLNLKGGDSSTMQLINHISFCKENHASIERFVVPVHKQWDLALQNGLQVRGIGLCKLVRLKINDKAHNAYYKHLMGHSGTYACCHCNEIASNFHLPLCERMPTVRTGVLHVEPDGSQSLITITEPLKTRMFLDETCGHKFWEHECCCSSVLGAY